MDDISRLSPYNIEDDLVRSRLYREIRDGQNATEWPVYTVQPVDELRPEFIAYKVYGTREMKWLIMIAASLDDMRERIEAGTALRLPKAVWVRKRIKYYSEL
jgi:hypothetical protein